MNISNLDFKNKLYNKLNLLKKNIEIFESIPSTNKFFKSHIKANPSSELKICIAEQQTNGVGTKGKTWHSPAVGNIYLTYKIKLHQSKLLALPIISALAASIAIEDLHPEIKVNVKWPNDLFINHKKIGGILIETLTPTPTLSNNKSSLLSVLIGIGININSPNNKDNNIIDQPFTDLTTEICKNSNINTKKIRKIDKCDIIINLIKNINKYKTYLSKPQKKEQESQINKLLKSWNIKDQYFQKKIAVKIRVNGKDEILVGTHNGITNNGELNLNIIDQKKEQKKTIFIRDGSIIGFA